MLADAVAGTPRFFAPGPAVKVAAGLARRPRGVARRARGLTTELARAATGRSQLAPAGGDRRFARPRLAGELAAARAAPGLPRRRRDGRRADRRCRRGLAHRAPGAAGRRERDRRDRADQLPVVEPRRAAGDRRHRRSQPGQGAAPAGPRPVHAAAAPGDGRHEPLRGRRQPGRHPGLGGPAQRGARAHPLPAADRRRCARRRCWSSRRRSTSTTSSTWRPGRSLIEYLVAQGQQVFAISWRNPDQEQGHFDLDTYARAISEARERGGRDLPGRRRPRRGRVLGRDRHRGAGWDTSPRPASWARSPA